MEDLQRIVAQHRHGLDVAVQRHTFAFGMQRLAALHTVLVALHSWTETSPAPGARRLNTAIWHTLRDGTERRRLAIGHF